MMKFRMRRTNTKVLLILAILVFGVFIRIGYALLSQDLTIGGLAIASKTVWGVHFVENSIVEDFTHLDSCSNGDECSSILKHATIGQDGKSISFGLTFHEIDEYYEFTVDVINDGTIDAMLNEIIKDGLSGNSDYLDFTVTYSDGMPIAQYDQLLKNGGTETLKVKVKCISELENDLDVNLGVTANYIKGNNNMQSRSYDPETMIRSLNTLNTSIADDDPDNNLRFIGANPNNYVSFNNQKWRIIGVFDGRLKIIQESIGNYPWNSSKENDGWGVNQWGPNNNGYTGAAIMKLLNPGYETNTDLKCKTKVSWFMVAIECNKNNDSDYTTGLVNNSLYWNASSGTCYTFGNYDVGACNFTSTGLSDVKSKNMIDNTTWHLGANLATDDINNNDIENASYLYNSEYSNNTGKQCSGFMCTDTVTRTTTWQGKVGLMYPSDYAYATGGGNTYSRSDCLGFYIGPSSSFSGWSNTYTECSANDWLYTNEQTWAMNPWGDSSIGFSSFHINNLGYVNGNGVANAYAIRPVVYLKSGISFTNEGDGTQARPYILRDLSNVHTVTFDANGGVITPTTKQVDAGSNIGTLPTPTAPTGKTFDGWYTASTGGTKITSSYTPTGNVTVYAHWLQIYDPETRIRALNTLNTSIADDDPDSNLRFIGANPNNYVSFNNQKWRIIGVFDGRLKIIQESIGNYPWDSSKNDVNNKFGVNQWGPNNNGYTGAAIMKLLNPGYETNTDFKCKTEVNLFGFCNNNNDSDYTTGLVNNSLYWNASSGACYNYGNCDVRACDFTSTGLSDTESKNMIDNAIWYLGSNSVSQNIFEDGTVTASLLYEIERSNNNGKQCTEGASCTDTVERTTRWQGKVGLMYPSDYAYATSGGNTYSRNDCLGYDIGDRSESGWRNTYTECGDNDWLLDKSIETWTITPGSSTTSAALAIRINKTSYVHMYTIANAYSIRPTVYLKSSVKIVGTGTGTYDNPFVLKIIE